MAKKKTAQTADGGKPKRPGPKGNFHGLRLEFLESKLPTFLDKVADKKTQEWWPVLHAEYWRRISWRVPADQDIDPELFKNASVPMDDDEDLTEEEQQTKRAVMAKTNPIVKTWFTNRKNKGTPRASVWSPFIKHLVQSTAGVTKKLNMAQYYMTHDDYKAKVDEEVERRVREDKIPTSEHLKIRSYVAKKFFLQEDEETKDRLQQENDLAHNKMLAAHKSASSGLPPIEPGAQDEALDELEELVQPLLNGFEACTGLRFVLIGGRAPQQEGSKYKLEVMHSITPGYDVATWRDWDKDAFKKNVLGHFIKYLHATQAAPSAPKITNEFAPMDCTPSWSSSSPSASASLSPTPDASSSGAMLCIKPTNAPSSSRAPSSGASATSKARSRSSSLDIPSSSSYFSSPAVTPPPRPKPRPAYMQSSLLPTHDHERFWLPLPDILLPYPCICRRLNELDAEMREVESMRMALSSDEERHQEESRLDSEEFVSRMDPTQFQALCDSLDGDFTLGFLPPTNELQHPEIMNQRVSVEADLDGHATPRRASRIAGNAIMSTHASFTPTTPNQNSNSVKIPIHQPQSPLESHMLPSHIDTPKIHSAPVMPTPPLPRIQTPHYSISPHTLAMPISQMKTHAWPEWLKTWYATFSALPFGEAWQKLIGSWIELERGYGFVSPPKGLTGRLELIQDWAKAKFATDFRPSPMPPNEIAEIWWSWWAAINSPTRLASASNRLLPGDDGADIEIAKLRAPGKHGWLSLLYSLMLWREWVGDGEKNDWEAAVVDVHWVTRRLCKSSYYCPTAEVIPTLKRPLDVTPADTDSGRSKRVKAARSYRF